MDRRRRAADTFVKARSILGGDAGLVPAHRALDAIERELDAAMRVALVGRISSGKSTLANALLGGEVAATGAEELTFNVAWMRYADRPA